MAVSADIAFVQGPNSEPAGEAVQGTLTDGAVTVSNGNDAGVVSWFFELLYVPPGSALGLPTQGPGGVATFVFGPPDVAGSYRVRLTVTDAGGSTDTDIRNFCVPFPNGVIAPPYQRNPTPLALTGAGGKADEMNVAGQQFGWDGEDAPSAFLLYQVLQLVDTFTTAGEANTASNVGGATGLFKQKTGIDLEFLTLAAGANITLTPAADTIVIASADTGEVNLAANVGAAVGLFRDKTGVTLNFKTLIAGTNITLVPAADTITIDAASGAGEANTGANVGGATGESFRDKTGTTLNFKTISGGTDITVTNNTDTIDIAVTGGAGEVNTASNVGTGVGVFKQKTGVDFEFKSIISTDGSLTVASAANEVDIETALPIGRSTPSLSFSHSSDITLSSSPKSPVWSTAFHPSVDTAVFTYPTSGSISANEVKVLVKGMYRLHAGAVALLTSGSYINPGVAIYKAGVLVAGTEGSTSGDGCVNINGYTITVELELAVDDVVTPGWHKFSGNVKIIGTRTHFSIDLVRTT